MNCMPRISRYLLPLLLLLNVSAQAQDSYVDLRDRNLFGRVIGFASPNVLELKVVQDDKWYRAKVVLADVDFGEQAFVNCNRKNDFCKRYSSLLKKMDVSVAVTNWKHPAHGYIVGEVFDNRGQSVNRQLIREGLFRADYSSRDLSLSVLEKEARCDGRGIWADHPDAAKHQFYCDQ